MTVKEYQQSVEMTRKRKEKTVSDKEMLLIMAVQ